MWRLLLPLTQQLLLQLLLLTASMTPMLRRRGLMLLPGPRLRELLPRGRPMLLVLRTGGPRRLLSPPP